MYSLHLIRSFLQMNILSFSDFTARMLAAELRGCRSHGVCSEHISVTGECLVKWARRPVGIMAADVKVTPKCSLDSNGCVTLQDILISFNAPITEQHAWALCHQCAKCFKNAIETDRGRCCIVSKVEHVLIHKEGQVHSNTIFAGGGSSDTGKYVTVVLHFTYCLSVLLLMNGSIWSF